MSSTKVYGPVGEIRPFLDHSITMHYMSTIPDQGGKIIAEYVWIGGSGADLRSKARTLAKVPTKPEDLPHWNYDGSSTGQAPGTDSEVYLVPRAIFRCVMNYQPCYSLGCCGPSVTAAVAIYAAAAAAGERCKCRTQHPRKAPAAVR